VRLAVLFRRPVREIADWPAWEVRLIEKFLAREPSAEDRVEIALAHIAAVYFNSQSRQGAPQIKTSDLLLFMDPWQADPLANFADERYSDLDREIFGQLK
jgi:hypothetical protein